MAKQAIAAKVMVFIFCFLGSKYQIKAYDDPKRTFQHIIVASVSERKYDLAKIIGIERSSANQSAVHILAGK